MQILQENLHLATLLENLSRKGQIGELVVTELLSLEKGEAISKLINLLMSQNPSSSRDMCDALQETHPDISDKVGLGPLPGKTITVCCSRYTSIGAWVKDNAFFYTMYCRGNSN